jgi:maltose O-acetyltransferase
MPSEKELMLAGEPYDAQDPELRAERARSRELCERFNSGPDPALLAELLGSFGDGAEILAPFQCDYGWQINVGARTFINYGCVVLDAAAVTIGDDVQVGPAVQLLTAVHLLDAAERRRGTETAAPVAIGDGAWLAAGVIVCPGVSIGTDTVVGAGSVVTRDLPAGHLCVGNPCRVVRELYPLRSTTWSQPTHRRVAPACSLARRRPCSWSARSHRSSSARRSPRRCFTASVPPARCCCGWSRRRSCCSPSGDRGCVIGARGN